MIPTYRGYRGHGRKGGRIQILQTIGKDSARRKNGWKWSTVTGDGALDFCASFKSASKAAHLCDMRPEVDTFIEYNSPAAALLRSRRRRLRCVYRAFGSSVQNANEIPYVVDSVTVDEAHLVRFKTRFMQRTAGSTSWRRNSPALDKTRKAWCRNPSQGGYEIPLWIA